jgi:hypothetical protein
MVLAPQVELDRRLHDPFINAPIFDQACFSLFLIADLAAIAPLYGELALNFCLLEAGSMSHLLMTAAPVEGIGLCPIGTLDFGRIRPLFALEERHVLVHSLLGGRVARDATGSWVPEEVIHPYQQHVLPTDHELEQGEI